MGVWYLIFFPGYVFKYPKIKEGKLVPHELVIAGWEFVK